MQAATLRGTLLEYQKREKNKEGIKKTASWLVLMARLPPS